MKNTRRLFLVLAILFSANGYLCGQEDERAQGVPAASEPEEGWAQVKSAYFTIYYRPDANVKRIVGRLFGRDFSVAHPPASALNALQGPEAKMAFRLDTLLVRVREILGMFPRPISLNVKIFRSRKDVNGEFCRLTRSVKGCRSFYVYAHNTIYTSEQDISDSVLAHEIAHALLDHYFSTTPPENVAEIVAQNVDRHLDD